MAIRGELLSEILNMGETELLQLNKYIISAIRSKRAVTKTVAASRFYNGQKVTFVGRHGMRYEGEIIKVNRTACKVRVTTGGLWNVDATLLERVNG